MPTDLSEDIPNFYRQVLYAWYELKKQLFNAIEIQREVLWYNKDIQIENVSVLFKKHYTRTVSYV